MACGSAEVIERPDRTAQGYRQFRCCGCGRGINKRRAGVLHRTQYPSDVISLVVPKQRFRATDWAEYDAALRGRGSLTVRFTDAAIAAWKAEPRTTWGGQPRCSPLAIDTALTLRTVYRLALRQTERLSGSIVTLLGLDLPVPDYSTVDRPGRDTRGVMDPAWYASHTLAGGQHRAAALRA
ncbi:transposase [Roseomonas sp. GCM10028921]